MTACFWNNNSNDFFYGNAVGEIFLLNLEAKKERIIHEPRAEGEPVKGVDEKRKIGPEVDMIWNTKKDSLLWLQANNVMIKRTFDLKDVGINYNNTLGKVSIESSDQAGIPLSRICINPEDKCIYISNPNNEYVKYVIGDDRNDGFDPIRIEMTNEAKLRLKNLDPKDIFKLMDSEKTLNLGLFARLIRRRFWLSCRRAVGSSHDEG